MRSFILAMGLMTCAVAGANAAESLKKCDQGNADRRIACLQKNIEVLASNMSKVKIQSTSGTPTKCVANHENVQTNMADCGDGPTAWRIIPQ